MHLVSEPSWRSSPGGVEVTSGVATLVIPVTLGLKPDPGMSLTASRFYQVRYLGGICRVGLRLVCWLPDRRWTLIAGVATQ